MSFESADFYLQILLILKTQTAYDMKQPVIILSLSMVFCLQLSLRGRNNIYRQKEIKKASPVLLAVGEKIQGSFIGDGSRSFATAVKVVQGQGNPVEGGTPDQYEIQFSDSRLKPVMDGCCNIRLINEGDLNDDHTDEISVFQAPMNGCTYSMTTYSYKNGGWKKLVETFLIPTGCESVTDQDLQKRVFRKDGIIYYYDSDPNQNGKLIKKKAVLNSFRKI